MKPRDWEQVGEESDFAASAWEVVRQGLWQFAILSWFLFLLHAVCPFLIYGLSSAEPLRGIEIRFGRVFLDSFLISYLLFLAPTPLALASVAFLEKWHDRRRLIAIAMAFVTLVAGMMFGALAKDATFYILD